MELAKDIFSVGALDADRRLFDEIIPLPDGTSYNSYIIKDEKIALIDTADPTKTEILLKNLDELGIKRVDYLVSNHAEQDHSGSIPAILQKYPEAKVVCSDKAKQMLIDLLHINEDKIVIVKDRETISLGSRTLEFIYTPWVHWPETMCTYLREDKILFSCDFFGSHLAENGFVNDERKTLRAAKRYYAEIMMPFRAMIKRNIEVIESLEVKVIAPSHGPIYNNPQVIIESYKNWISDNTEKKVIIAYVSMHSSTKIMAEYLYEALKKKGIEVKLFNLTGVDIGDLAIELVDASTVILGTPYFLTSLHPTAANTLYLVNALKPKTKYFSVISSYGWGGKTIEDIKSMLPNIKAEIIAPVLAKGLARDSDFKELDRLADEINKKL